MIHFKFGLFNPFSKTKFDPCFGFNKHGKLSKYKSWEIEYERTNVIINFGFELSVRRSHAGISLWVGLLGHSVSFEICDDRHWDYDNNCWEVYEKR